MTTAARLPRSSFTGARGELPIQLESVTLVNSDLYYDLAQISAGQHLLRMERTRGLASSLLNRRLYKRGLRGVFAEPTPHLDAELDVLWDLMSRRDGKRAIGWISHYLEERRGTPKVRWDEAIRSFDGPRVPQRQRGVKRAP